jgi:Flp pilus assembly protein TadG
MFKKSRVVKRRSDGRRRSGVAVVELAVCLPILVVLLIATIEACVMLQLQQNLAVTAYEGARVGIIPGLDAGTVDFQCRLILDDRNINGYTITLDPVDPQTMNLGDEFKVTIAADCAANSVVGGMYFDGKTISESVVMRAE